MFALIVTVVKGSTAFAEFFVVTVIVVWLTPSDLTVAGAADISIVATDEIMALGSVTVRELSLQAASNATIAASRNDADRRVMLVWVVGALAMRLCTLKFWGS